MGKKPFDVVILGAGAAGIAAADALVKRKRRVCILEAQGHPGGRARSLYGPGFALPVELGAEFFSTGDSTLLKRLGKWHKKQAYDGTQLCYDGDSLSDCGPDWAPVTRVLSEFDGSDVTAGRYLRQLRKEQKLSERQLRLAEGYIEGYHAAPLGRIGMISIADQESVNADPGGEMTRIRDGFDSLFTEWAKKADCEIRYNAVAHTVHWKPGAVTVHAKTRTGQDRTPIQASKLIVALPLGVLRSRGRGEGSVRFDPPLKESDQFLAELGVGQVVKVVFRLEEGFYQSALRGGEWLFLHARGLSFPTWWSGPNRKDAWITAWAGGPAAARLIGKQESLLVRRAAESLGAMFNRSVAEVMEGMEAWYTHDWQTDPYTRMAYSYLPAGTGAAQEALRRPIGDTIWLAGEHLAPTAVGTVHGAAVSGERAATGVLKAS